MDTHVTPDLRLKFDRPGLVGLGIPLVGFAALTAAKQLGVGSRIIKKLDRTGFLIPNWRFFAPFPASHEYHLLYRDEWVDGSMTEWREIDIVKPRSPSQVIWAPHRRMEKGLLDATSELIAISEMERGSPQVFQSSAYLALLAHVANGVEHHSQASRTQFLIIRAAAYEEEVIPDPLFLSKIHRLKEDA